jgi:hypothetical protein
MQVYAAALADFTRTCKTPMTIAIQGDLEADQLLYPGGFEACHIKKLALPLRHANDQLNGLYCGHLEPPTINGQDRMCLHTASGATDAKRRITSKRHYRPKHARSCHVTPQVELRQRIGWVDRVQA